MFFSSVARARPQALNSTHPDTTVDGPQALGEWVGEGSPDLKPNRRAKPEGSAPQLTVLAVDAPNRVAQGVKGQRRLAVGDVGDAHSNLCSA